MAAATLPEVVAVVKHTGWCVSTSGNRKVWARLMVKPVGRSFCAMTAAGGLGIQEPMANHLTHQLVTASVIALGSAGPAAEGQRSVLPE